MNVRIAHETATQRQHVRVRIPLTVQIDGQVYEADNWSVAGLGLVGVSPTPSSGTIMKLELTFHFEGFAFEMDMEGEVRRADPATGSIGVRFINLTQGQMDLLQYIVGAYISGEIVQSSDLLSILKRENTTKPRAASNDDAKPKGASQVFAIAQRVLLLGFLWALGLALVGVIVFNAFVRSYVVVADGVLTSPETAIVRAPKSGTVLAFNAKSGVRVQPQGVLATLQGADDAIQPITANCDCVVAQTFAAPSGFVAKGAPLLSLVPSEGRLSADFVVPLQTAQRVRAGDRSTVIFYAGQSEALGRVERVVLPTFAETNAFANVATSSLQLTAIVRVRFEKRLPASFVGQPASVRISTFRPFA